MLILVGLFSCARILRVTPPPLADCPQPEAFALPAKLLRQLPGRLDLVSTMRWSPAYLICLLILSLAARLDPVKCVRFHLTLLSSSLL